MGHHMSYRPTCAAIWRMQLIQSKLYYRLMLSKSPGGTAVSIDLTPWTCTTLNRPEMIDWLPDTGHYIIIIAAIILICSVSSLFQKEDCLHDNVMVKFYVSQLRATLTAMSDEALTMSGITAQFGTILASFDMFSTYQSLSELLKLYLFYESDTNRLLGYSILDSISDIESHGVRLPKCRPILDGVYGGYILSQTNISRPSTY